MDVFFRPAENIVQHVFREPSGLGVLLAGVVGTDHHSSIVEDRHCSVAERRCG